MGDLIIPEKPKHLAQTGNDTTGEFAGGVSGGMPLPALSIRSKKFRARLDQQEQELGGDNGLEVILVAARPHISKRYFESDYTPGDNPAPDCSSIDGKTPDVAEPVSPNCASCPKNVFGSKGAGKACGDYKRLVVLPLVNGAPVSTPVVLDVPATSLKTPKAMRGGTDMMLKEYMAALGRHQIDPTTAVSVISFTGADYPQLCWTFDRYVTEEEINLVREHRDSEAVQEVLGEDVQPGDVPAPTPEEQPAQTAQPAQKAAEPEPEPEPKKTVWVHDAANEKVWQAPESQVPEGCKVVSEDKARKLQAIYEDDEDDGPTSAQPQEPQPEPAGEAKSEAAEPAAEPAAEGAAGEGASEDDSGEGDDDVMAEVENLLKGLE